MSKKQEEDYWSLYQATAWVMYRSKARVEEFADFGPEEWTAFEFYGMDEIEEIGSSKELFDAFETGRLAALGRRSDGGTVMEEIPAIEWRDLVPMESGPYLRSASGGKIEPWLNICVRRADIEKLWRAPSETEARTRYDWKKIQKIHDDVRELNPKFSDNQLITEIQGQFRDTTNREPPARTSIQRHMKDW